MTMTMTMRMAVTVTVTVMTVVLSDSASFVPAGSHPRPGHNSLSVTAHSPRRHP